MLRSQIDGLVANGRLDPRLSKGLVANVYEMPDGRVLLVYGDRIAFLDDSYAELVKWFDANAHRTGTIEEMFPQRERFAEMVPDLIASLPHELRMQGKTLDFTGESVAEIDRAIRRQSRSDLLRVEVYSALIAYVGEVMRVRTGSRWEMEQDPRDHLWTPMVVTPVGKRYSPARFYKELLEMGRRASVAAFLAGTLL